MQARPRIHGSKNTRLCRSTACLQLTTMAIAVGVLFSSLVRASPTVEGNIISWPDDGWYQVQRSDDNESVCEGGSSCEVDSGIYRVINLSTGERFNNVAVGNTGGESRDGIVVTGNVISWPDDGWYQVQTAGTYESLCGGESSCEVPAGEYVVINHTTGVRFDNVVVTAGEEIDDNEEPETTGQVVVDGYEVSWPDDGWYQVQLTGTYESFCQGGTSCEVPAGTYTVINLTTGDRFPGVEVAGGEIISRSLELDKAVPAVLSQLAGYQFERDAETIEDAMQGIQSRSIGESELTVSNVTFEDPRGPEDVPLSSVTFACEGGGEVAVGIAELVNIEGFRHISTRYVYDFDACVDEGIRYKGLLSIERGRLTGQSSITNYVVHEKQVKFGDFEKTRDDVWLLNAKGSVSTRELTTSSDETKHDTRTVDISRYTNETAHAEGVSFELSKKSEGTGALLTYGLTANGLVSSDRGTSGQSVNVRTESAFSRVIGLGSDGGFSLNGSDAYAGIMQLSAEDGSELTVSVNPGIPESKSVLVDYSLMDAGGISSEQAGEEFVDLYINVIPEDPR